MLAINVPKKVWRPKAANRYKSPIYDDISDDIFEFPDYGKCMIRIQKPWEPSTRTDIISYDPSKHETELVKDLHIPPSCEPSIKKKIIDIIKEYWDCFDTAGCKRTIIGFVFRVDTGDAPPVCCRKQAYGYFESKIILKQINDLLHNNWIRRCGGPWGSRIVLAPKPHQEECISIDEFVWRMCVSYRALNTVTKPFQYPIPRCDASIDTIGEGSVCVYIIVLDCRQGYHQVAVHPDDQEKLAFFSPDGEKYCFTVMPFGATNAPPFFSAMIKCFKDEWTHLFIKKTTINENFRPTTSHS